MDTQILIFKTDIASAGMVRSVHPIFKNYPIILDWSVDIEDIDHVLRVEVVGDMSEREVMQLMGRYGIFCEPLGE